MGINNKEGTEATTQGNLGGKASKSLEKKKISFCLVKSLILKGSNSFFEEWGRERFFFFSKKEWEELIKIERLQSVC